MKTKILTQAQKAHNINQLHEKFVQQGYLTADSPSPESTPDGSESKFYFDDSVSDTAIQAVIDNHTPVVKVPLDIKVAIQEIEAVIIPTNGLLDLAKLDARQKKIIEKQDKMIKVIKELAKRVGVDLNNG